MKSPHLSAFGLRRAIVAGGRRVIAQRSELNRINVFPVADHDTGSNLTSTLSAVLQGLAAASCSHADEVLHRAAAEAIDNARGNSGAILAHFLQGIAESVAPGQRLTPAVLAQAVAHGNAKARSALAAPCDGTILSVIQAFADELTAQAGAGDRDFRACFGPALACARSALRRTPQQLKVLRAASVVDAGACGFVDLLEGIADYVARGRAALRAAPPLEPPVAGIESAAGLGATVDAGPCAECVVRAEVVDRAALKAALLSLAAVTSGDRRSAPAGAGARPPGGTRPPVRRRRPLWRRVARTDGGRRRAPAAPGGNRHGLRSRPPGRGVGPP